MFYAAVPVKNKMTQRALILRLFSSIHQEEMPSILMESVKSFSQDNSINYSERVSVIVVLRFVLMILSPLNVLSSFATVTGAVISSLNALLVSGKADLQSSENLAASARDSSFFFVRSTWLTKFSNSA